MPFGSRKSRWRSSSRKAVEQRGGLSLSLLMLTRKKRSGWKSSVQENDMNSHEVILQLPRTCPAGTPSEKF